MCNCAIHVTRECVYTSVCSTDVLVKYAYTCSYQYVTENKYYMCANVCLGYPKISNTKVSPERIIVDQCRRTFGPGGGLSDFICANVTHYICTFRVWVHFAKILN